MWYVFVSDLEYEGPGATEVRKVGVWRTRAEFAPAPPRLFATVRNTVHSPDRIPLTVEVRYGTFVLERHLVEPTATATIEIATKATGTVDVWVKGPTWLADKKTVDLGLNAPVSFDLANGDVDGNNSVNVADFLLLRQAFGSSGYAFDAAADPNGDGSVGIADLLILRQAFGRIGAA